MHPPLKITRNSSYVYHELKHCNVSRALKKEINQVKVLPAKQPYSPATLDFTIESPPSLPILFTSYERDPQACSQIR